MRAKDIMQRIEEYAPPASGIAGDELGLLAGDPADEVHGIATCWSPTLDVLNEAAAKRLNLVLSHEPLLFDVCGRDPEAGLKWYDERHVSAKVPNQKRLAAVFAHNLTVCRYHSNWDWAPRYGQVDMLARVLELGERTGGVREAPVFTIAPATVGDLAARAVRTLGLGPCRLVGDRDRSVSRVAVCQGGFGQMFTFGEIAADAGAEFAFFGEMLDYTIRYCREIGLAAIELGHYRSEHPGMMGMAEFLRECLGDTVPVECLQTKEAWSWAGIDKREAT